VCVLACALVAGWVDHWLADDLADADVLGAGCGAVAVADDFTGLFASLTE
jgi:hypothetical protein